MMGRDIERIVAGIDSVKDKLARAIELVADNSGYKIETHGWADERQAHGEEVEKEASDLINDAISAMDSLNPDVSKMQTLGSKLYTSVGSFNNSYGSPWREISNLKSSMSKLSSVQPIKYMGDRVRLLGYLNVALGRAIDAKWAMTTYHDYIQRGYDYKYNDRQPSCPTQRTASRQSTGNLNQQYAENVNIKEKPIAPF